MTLARAVALGGLTVGTLDGLDAVILFGLRDVSPNRIFQAIATTIVAVACIAVRRVPALARKPMLAGSIYGVGVGAPALLFARAVARSSDPAGLRGA